MTPDDRLRITAANAAARELGYRLAVERQAAQAAEYVVAYRDDGTVEAGRLLCPAEGSAADALEAGVRALRATPLG